MDVNGRLADGYRLAVRLEDDLATAYRVPLLAAARRSVTRFRALAAGERGVTAAVQPWDPPDPDELVDTDALQAKTSARAAPIHERVLRLVGRAAVGTGFDVANPFAVEILAQAAGRAAGMLDGFGDQIAVALTDAHAQGLSVDGAAKLLQARGVDAANVAARMLARTTLNGVANGGSLLAASLVNDASLAAGETGVGGKTWLTAGDERVRDAHAEADGQTVPLDQPFDIGGEQLLYPGDPNGSDEQICNCRCVVTYGDSLAAAAVAPTDGLQSQGTMIESLPDTGHASLVAAAESYSGGKVSFAFRDFHLTAAAGEPTRWQATLLVEDEPTEDGRMVAAGAVSWRGLPLPLAILSESMHSDGGEAPVCGRIDQIWRAGNLIQAAGVFDSSEFGVEAERLVTERMITGISCDGVLTASDVVAIRRDDSGEDAALEDEVDGVVEGDPVVEDVYDDDMEYLFVATEYVIMGATICPAPAMAQARINVVTADGGEQEEWRIVAPFQPSRSEVPSRPVVASAVDLGPVEARLDKIEAAVTPFTLLAAGLPGQLEELELGMGEIAALTSAVGGLEDRTRSKFAAIDEHLDGLKDLVVQSRTDLRKSMDVKLTSLPEIHRELRSIRETVDRTPRQVHVFRSSDTEPDDA